MMLILISCEQAKKEKKLSKDEIRQEAMEEGNRIALETQQALASQLKFIIERDGIPQALKYCNVHAYPIVDSLEKKHDVGIKRASLHVRNPKDKPDEEEADILAEYESAIANGQTPSPVVILDDKQVRYARPIILSNQLCLNCHGIIGKDIKENHYEVIRALYPEDNATGFKLGDLRGIWSIKFNREYFEK